MWADSVDQWLEKNSVRGGHNPNDFFGNMVTFAWKLTFYIFTFGLGYFLVRMFRSKETWYYTDIFSRKNKTQNIQLPRAKKLAEKILEKEMITLGNDEELLFLVKDQNNNDNGILFTNKRMVYNLVKPNFTALIATSSGQISVSDLSKKMSAEAGMVNLVISVNGENIGKLENAKPKIIDEFLGTIRKSIANASIV